MFFQPVYLKCDIMNNAGIVDRVDCACKLNCVLPETQNPLHALLGDHLYVDEICIPIVDTIVPERSLLGEDKIPSITSTASTSLNNKLDIVSFKPSCYTEYQNDTNKEFISGKKKIVDKHGKHKSMSLVSNCICRTHKWKFPMIMQKPWRHNRRVRLKSKLNFDNTFLQRYQSHHSSSDEDWFEEIADDELHNSEEKKKTYNSNENITLANQNDNVLNFDNESEHVPTNKFKLCSFAIRKCFNRQSLAETKITHKHPTNSCRII